MLRPLLIFALESLIDGVEERADDPSKHGSDAARFACDLIESDAHEGGVLLRRHSGVGAAVVRGEVSFCSLK